MPSPFTLPVRYTRRKPPLGAPLRRGHPLVTPWWGPSGNNRWVSELIMPMLEGAGSSTANLGIGTASSGTLHGGVSWSTSPFGPALSFDGSTGYVECDSGTGTSVVMTDICIEGWVYMPSSSCHGCAFIFGGNFNNSGFGLGVGSGNIETNGNHLIGLYQDVRWIDSGATVSVGWHHIAMQVDHSGFPHIYLDGAQVYTDTIGGMLAPGPDGERVIGNDPQNTSRYWPGKIASCSMFRRQRSAQEIRSLYLAPFQMF